MISHTDARLAARCAAVSGDVRSRSTGCTVSRVGVLLNTFSGLATGHLTVAGNGVGAGSAIGFVCKNATHIRYARIICTFFVVVTSQRRRNYRICCASTDWKVIEYRPRRIIQCHCVNLVGNGRVRGATGDRNRLLEFTGSEVAATTRNTVARTQSGGAPGNRRRCSPGERYCIRYGEVLNTVISILIFYRNRDFNRTSLHGCGRIDSLRNVKSRCVLCHCRRDIRQKHYAEYKRKG